MAEAGDGVHGTPAHMAAAFRVGRPALPEVVRNPTQRGRRGRPVECTQQGIYVNCTWEDADRDFGRYKSTWGNRHSATLSVLPLDAEGHVMEVSPTKFMTLSGRKRSRARLGELDMLLRVECTTRLLVVRHGTWRHTRRLVHFAALELTDTVSRLMRDAIASDGPQLLVDDVKTLRGTHAYYEGDAPLVQTDVIVVTAAADGVRMRNVGPGDDDGVPVGNVGPGDGVPVGNVGPGDDNGVPVGNVGPGDNDGVPVGNVGPGNNDEVLAAGNAPVRIDPNAPGDVDDTPEEALYSPPSPDWSHSWDVLADNPFAYLAAGKAPPTRAALPASAADLAEQFKKMRVGDAGGGALPFVFTLGHTADGREHYAEFGARATLWVCAAVYLRKEDGTVLEGTKRLHWREETKIDATHRRFVAICCRADESGSDSDSESESESEVGVAEDGTRHALSYDGDTWSVSVERASERGAHVVEHDLHVVQCDEDDTPVRRWVLHTVVHVGGDDEE